MVTITREGTKIKVCLDPSMFDNKVIPLIWDCGNDWYADLLAQRLQDLMAERLRAIREESYEQGRKDAKARRAKADWHRSVW